MQQNPGNAFICNFSDIRDDAQDYFDLRGYQDDRRMLRNPHKGWYWHYIDNGYARSAYRAEHDPDDLLLDFPGLNHLYLRFDWNDIEKKEGNFDWSYIDEIFEKWGNAGYRFSFRPCTYEGGAALAYATPKWVFDSGAKFQSIDGAVEPDYGDAIYLAKLESFMAEFGRKYNGHPLVETVDIGTYGTWGEGHTYRGSDRAWPLWVMKRHIDLHLKYFPDTVLLLNDDMINHRSAYPNEENIELMEYAINKRIGLRDDSVCVASYAARFGYTTLRTPFMFDHFYPVAPVDLEFEHYKSVADDVLKQGFPFLDAMLRTHCTFAGFHGYPRPWLDKYPDLTEYCANRLGYWYFLESAVLPTMKIGCSNRVELRLSNRGFSRAYWPYKAKIRFAGEGIVKDFCLPIDNRTWEPGEIKENFFIRPESVKPGQYEVQFGLFEGEHSIELGMKKESEIDGFYYIGQIKLED